MAASAPKTKITVMHAMPRYMDYTGLVRRVQTKVGSKVTSEVFETQQVKVVQLEGGTPISEIMSELTSASAGFNEATLVDSREDGYDSSSVPQFSVTGWVPSNSSHVKDFLKAEKAFIKAEETQQKLQEKAAAARKSRDEKAALKKKAADLKKETTEEARLQKKVATEVTRLTGIEMEVS